MGKKESYLLVPSRAFFPLRSVCSEAFAIKVISWCLPEPFFPSGMSGVKLFRWIAAFPSLRAQIFNGMRKRDVVFLPWLLIYGFLWETTPGIRAGIDPGAMGSALNSSSSLTLITLIPSSLPPTHQPHTLGIVM